MAWRRPGDKPLSENQWLLIYPCIYASLGLNELAHYGQMMRIGEQCVVFFGSGNDLALYNAKPLPEPVLTHYQLDPKKQTSVKI